MHIFMHSCLYITPTTQGGQLLNAAVILVGFAFPYPQQLIGRMQ